MAIRKSRGNRAIQSAWEAGYRVNEHGVVTSPSGEVRILRTNKGYKDFTFHFEGYKYPIKVHRFVAYAKYKTKALQEDVCVRHLDGDSLNNTFENIAIGTHQQNMLDRDPEDRLEHAMKAARKQRKLTQDQLDEFHRLREKGWSLQRLRKKYGIALSTASYIANGITYQKE